MFKILKKKCLCGSQMLWSTDIHQIIPFSNLYFKYIIIFTLYLKHNAIIPTFNMYHILLHLFVYRYF